jgi:hypothetical protein
MSAMASSVNVSGETVTGDILIIELKKRMSFRFAIPRSFIPERRQGFHVICALERRMLDDVLLAHAANHLSG